jgi:hypothetical protein
VKSPQTRSYKRRWPSEEAEEKDRFAAQSMADQPLHAGGSLGENLFPRENQAEFAEAAE